MKKGDSGEDVKQLQRAILALGHALPRWGADGVLGEETLVAANAVMRDYRAKFTADNVLTADEIEQILQLAVTKTILDAKLPDGYYDCRLAAKKEVDRGPRAWSNVTGICLHQTACLMGENAPRYEGIGAHIAITRSGKVFHMHDFNRIVWHGNGWNAQTVGIEIDGLYAGIDGDLKTVWDDPSTAKREMPVKLSDAACEAARQTITWICDEVRKHSGHVNALVAHRQSSKDRRNDPGSEIWQRIALPMSEQLGLSDGGDGFRIGTGYPIPEAWDPRKKGIPY